MEGPPPLEPARASYTPTPRKKCTEMQRQFSTNEPNQCDKCLLVVPKITEVDFDRLQFKLCVNCYKGCIAGNPDFWKRAVEAVAYDEKAQRRIEALEEETHREFSRARALRFDAEDRAVDAAQAPELRRTVEALRSKVDRKDDDLEALNARLDAVVANIEHHPNDLREIDRLRAERVDLLARIHQLEDESREVQQWRADVLSARRQLDEDRAKVRHAHGMMEKRLEFEVERKKALAAKVEALKSENRKLQSIPPQVDRETLQEVPA